MRRRTRHHVQTAVTGDKYWLPCVATTAADGEKDYLPANTGQREWNWQVLQVIGDGLV